MGVKKKRPVELEADSRFQHAAVRKTHVTASSVTRSVTSSCQSHDRFTKTPVITRPVSTPPTHKLSATPKLEPGQSITQPP
jgi:hypothetical protein